MVSFVESSFKCMLNREAAGGRMMLVRLHRDKLEMLILQKRDATNLQEAKNIKEKRKLLRLREHLQVIGYATESDCRFSYMRFFYFLYKG